MTLQILKSGRYRSYSQADGLWFVNVINEDGDDKMVAMAHIEGAGALADGEHARFVDLQRVVGKEG